MRYLRMTRDCEVEMKKKPGTHNHLATKRELYLWANTTDKLTQHVMMSWERMTELHSKECIIHSKELNEKLVED